MTRAERRHRTYRFVQKQIKNLELAGIPLDENRIGKCKKKKALDCGHSSCFLCKPAYNKKKRIESTLQEKRFLLKAKEQNQKPRDA